GPKPPPSRGADAAHPEGERRGGEQLPASALVPEPERADQRRAEDGGHGPGGGRWGGGGIRPAPDRAEEAYRQRGGSIDEQMPQHDHDGGIAPEYYSLEHAHAGRHWRGGGAAG